MRSWMPRLQYPEFHESSRLVRIVKNTGTVVRG